VRARAESGALAVIIPYYQRDPGILRRALDSVRGQDLPAALKVHVYLVDDGSPRRHRSTCSMPME
jgi:succinoglycan biosynthesis protein ExoW